MSTTAARQRIATERYQAVYRRTPQGHGLWAFWLHGDAGEPELIFTSGLYREAAREARAIARQRGARRIELGT